MLTNLREQLQAWFRRAISYFKTAWDIEDYPVRLQRQDVESLKLRGRLRPIVWTAQVINWWQMAGHGDTKEEALANLGIAFESFRNSHETLPRPGTGAPLEFAPSILIERHEALARDLLHRVLDRNYDECLISDQSSLWDFHDGDSNDAVYQRISELYGVDVSGVDGAILAHILEKIAAHQRAS